LNPYVFLLKSGFDNDSLADCKVNFTFLEMDGKPRGENISPRGPLPGGWAQ
jgi:hypothetical protein